MKIVQTLISLSIMFLLSGCTMLNSTRSLPQTIVSNNKIPLKEELSIKPVFFPHFDTNNTDVEISHYEGILQSEQFWFAAPTDEQKNVLKSSALTLAFSGFASELIKNDVNLSDPKLLSHTSQGTLIKGHLKKITIKTYGNGFGGYGSAGDYWECYLDLEELKLVSLENGKVFDIKPIKTYAKVKGSPVKLGSFFELLKWSAKMASIPFVSVPQLLYDPSPFTEMPQYSLEIIGKSPVELSSRLAARNFLIELQNK